MSTADEQKSNREICYNCLKTLDQKGTLTHFHINRGYVLCTNHEYISIAHKPDTMDGNPVHTDSATLIFNSTIQYQTFVKQVHKT